MLEVAVKRTGMANIQLLRQDAPLECRCASCGASNVSVASTSVVLPRDKLRASHLLARIVLQKPEGLSAGEVPMTNRQMRRAAAQFFDTPQKGLGLAALILYRPGVGVVAGECGHYMCAARSGAGQFTLWEDARPSADVAAASVADLLRSPLCERFIPVVGMFAYKVRLGVSQSRRDQPG